MVDTVQKYEKFEQFLSSFPENWVLGFDTETTGLFVKKSHLVGLSISWDSGKAVYLPFRHKSGNNLPIESVLPRLLKLLSKFRLVFANGKFDTQVIYWESGVWLKIYSDILIERVLDDSTIAQSERRKSHFGLKQTAYDLFKIEMIDFEEITEGYPSIDYVNTENVRLYAPADADIARRAHFYLREKMQRENNPALKVILDIELSLVPIIAKMELNGITVDTEYASSLRAPTKEKLENLEKKFFKILKDDYGYEGDVSLTSPVQIVDLFYDKLKLPKVMVYRKKKGRREKTLTVGKEAYIQLGEKYPIVGVYHEFVTTKKLLRDFLENFEKKAVNGTMYCSIKQLGAETGRMSCVSVTKDVGVNMQQIPKKEDKSQGLSIRKIFKARPGYVFIDADLDQVELRIFAAESGAEQLLSDISLDRDLHISTASVAYKIPYESVTKDQRSSAKGMNYALTYGGDAGTLARKNKISREHAEEMYNAFFDVNPSAAKWMFEQVRFAEENKCILTRFGRKVRLLDDFRKAVNYKIQTSMQDIFKSGIIRADKAVAKLKSKYGEDSINMLLLVHDEILFEVKDSPEVIKEAVKAVKTAMEPKIPGYCKIVANIEVGKNWAETEEYVDETGSGGDGEIKKDSSSVSECSTNTGTPPPDLPSSNETVKDTKKDPCKLSLQISNNNSNSKVLPSQEETGCASHDLSLCSKGVEPGNERLSNTSTFQQQPTVCSPECSESATSHRIIVFLLGNVNGEAMTRLRFIAQALPGDIEVVVDKNKEQKSMPFKVSEQAFDKIKTVFPMPLANVIMFDGNKLVKV